MGIVRSEPLTRRKEETTPNNLSVEQLLEGCEQALLNGRALLKTQGHPP
jgi:hypothetical protein